jgi:cytochrome c553
VKRVRPVPAAVAAVLMLATTPALAGGDPLAGQRRAAECTACHGADGNSPNPQFPRLAGQYADYLAQALRQYKSGARKNPIMVDMVSRLSERDIENVAAYFSRQRGLIAVRPEHAR